MNYLSFACIVPWISLDTVLSSSCVTFLYRILSVNNFVCVHTNALIFIVLLALVPITGCRSQNLLVSCMMLNNISVLGGAPLSTMSSNTAMAPAGPTMFFLSLSFYLSIQEIGENGEQLVASVNHSDYDTLPKWREIFSWHQSSALLLSLLLLLYHHSA